MWHVNLSDVVNLLIRPMKNKIKVTAIMKSKWNYHFFYPLQKVHIHVNSEIN